MVGVFFLRRLVIKRLGGAAKINMNEWETFT